MPLSDAPPTLEAVLGAIPSRAQAAIVTDDLRYVALREHALAYGVRAGLARRAYELQALMEGRAANLDLIFDFGRLLLDRNVLPPVLVSADRQLRLEDDATLRLTDQTLSIVAQARFVTAAPNWRDYLVRSISFTPPTLDAVLVPRSGAEREAFEAGVQQGWSAGVAQADQLFDGALARLRRDYDGMVLYRKLLAEKMVSKPYVAEADLGVTGDRSRLSIGERVLRITAVPGLEVASSKWRPIAVPQGPAPPPGRPGTVEID